MGETIDVSLKSDYHIIRFMPKKTISVTDAARNFADCVNRAHYQNVTFVLLKNGSPVARLVPDHEKGLHGPRPGRMPWLGPDLPAAEAEAAAWHRDLRAGRKTLKAPADKWQ